MGRGREAFRLVVDFVVVERVAVLTLWPRNWYGPSVRSFPAEPTSVEGDRGIRVDVTSATGRHLREPGEEVDAGDVVFTAGTILTAGQTDGRLLPPALA